ncbi:MAG: S-layer protein domain-containing protein [Methanosarcinales archaeon]
MTSNRFGMQILSVLIAINLNKSSIFRWIPELLKMVSTPFTLKGALVNIDFTMTTISALSLLALLCASLTVTTSIVSANDTQSWDLQEGYTIIAKEVDLDGKKVWLSLTKNGVEVDSEVLNEHEYYVYDNIDATVDAIFRGTQAKMVKLVNVNQYSEVDRRPLLLGASKVLYSYNPTLAEWKLKEDYVLTFRDVVSIVTRFG